MRKKTWFSGQTPCWSKFSTFAVFCLEASLNNQNKNRFEAEVKSIKAKMDSISGVYDDLNEKMHDVDKTMWVNLYLELTRTQMPWNTSIMMASTRAFVTLRTDDDLHLQQKQPSVLRNGSGLDPRTSKLARPEGTSSHSPLTTTSTLCQWLINNYRLDVNINPSNFSGPRPFQIQPWHHSPASFEEGGLSNLYFGYLYFGIYILGFILFWNLYFGYLYFGIYILDIYIF